MAGKRSSTPPSQATCIGCGDDLDKPQLTYLACGCSYCGGCIERMFDQALEDGRYHHMPRCCTGPIPFELIRRRLSPSLAKAYAAKKVELESKDRTYCHKTACAKFIAPHSIHNGQAFCQRCSCKTCSICKAEWHFGPCSAGSLKEVLELAKQNGWKRCPGCRHMVELIEGCAHMVCPCDCEFCYCCGEFTPCHCDGDQPEDYDEGNEGDQQEYQDPPTVQEVHVQEGHSDYVNVSWRGRVFICGLCDHRYRSWISQCRECGLNVCNRCRGAGGSG